MGIINITSDSFYDGGASFSSENILAQAETMLSEGATFLDLGGYSSRPGAEDISEEEETQRILRGTELILKEFPQALISIDTFRSKVAKRAIKNGAAIVNDISGGTLDPEMFTTIAELKAPYILMHMRGNPKTMASMTEYKNVTTEVIKDLSMKISQARAAGIDDIIVDPGFGFAKKRSQSFEILNNLELFHNLNVPILAGASRKSFIYTTLGVSPKEALNGTTFINTIALLKDASILRVHDVKEAVECVTLWKNLNG